MRITNLLMLGVVFFLGGIGLAAYGFYLTPKVGQVFTNLIDGKFTDKRNLLMVFGMLMALCGGFVLVASVFRNRRVRPAT